MLIAVACVRLPYSKIPLSELVVVVTIVTVVWFDPAMPCPRPVSEVYA